MMLELGCLFQDKIILKFEKFRQYFQGTICYLTVCESFSPKAFATDFEYVNLQ